MKLFFLVIVMIALTYGREIDIKGCEEKGFASTLLCSSCDKLASFVGDSGDMVEECQLCCLSDESDGTKVVKQVTLLTHPFFLSRNPEVSEFIQKYEGRYINLVINTRTNVPSARLQVVYESGKSEIVHIGGWKRDQIRDFCDSILRQVE